MSAGSNSDEAAKCVQVAQNAFNNGDLDKVSKSMRMSGDNVSVKYQTSCQLIRAYNDWELKMCEYRLRDF